MEHFDDFERVIHALKERENRAKYWKELYHQMVRDIQDTFNLDSEMLQTMLLGDEYCGPCVEECNYCHEVFYSNSSHFRFISGVESYKKDDEEQRLCEECSMSFKRKGWTLS